MVKKISIIGAGAVGGSVAYNLLLRTALKELVLVDVAGDLAKGIGADLEDTRGILGFTTAITGTKNISHIKNSDIVVIAAGVARKKGMTRLDLLKINGKIAKELSMRIKKLAPFSIAVVVTNPLDLVTYVVTKETKFPRSRVIGMGSSLDTSRLFNMVHKRTGLSVESLNGYAFGPHSKDMIISSERLNVAGEPLRHFLTDGEMQKISESVQMRGAEIVSYLKTRSAHFAPGLAAAALIEAIVTNANKVIPVSILLTGEYGLKNVCCGVPCVINRKGVESVVSLTLNAHEKKELHKIKDTFEQCMTSL